MSLFPKIIITDRESKDTGLAFALIFLLLFMRNTESIFGILTLTTLLLSMTIYRVFKPFAYVWFGFSQVMGSLVSKIILSLIFYVLLTPFSTLYRGFVNDTMDLKKFKKNTDTAFKPRSHRYTARDLQFPY